ncbi:hypothetical protein V5O48_009900 [Marasmius crinis-equi]|uniref:Uncharacterized protein n=1 Tax=Marasmius crinis-equi TaxID=585013 RepID=A0ABR3FAH0_9AGAR
MSDSRHRIDKPAQDLQEAVGALHWGNGRFQAISEELRLQLGKSEKAVKEAERSLGEILHQLRMDSAESKAGTRSQRSSTSSSATFITAASSSSPSRLSTTTPTNYSDPELDKLIGSLTVDEVDALCSPSKPKKILPSSAGSSKPKPNTSLDIPSHLPSIHLPASPMSTPSKSSRSKKRKGVYVFINGKDQVSGVFHEWYGKNGVLELTNGVSGVIHQKCRTKEEADQIYDACLSSGLVSALTDSMYADKWFLVLADPKNLIVCKRTELVSAIGRENLRNVRRDSFFACTLEKEASEIAARLIAGGSVDVI